MYDYLKIDPASFQVIEHLVRRDPLSGWNTRGAAEANKKAFIVPADRAGDDAFDPASQVKEGPVFEQLDRPRAVVRFTVRDKTAEELAADAAAKARAELAASAPAAAAIGEEIAQLLIDKGFIALADLSAPAQKLLGDRKAARGKLGDETVAGPRQAPGGQAGGGR